MRYLVTFIELGTREAFYTEWFTLDNFEHDKGMIVFDLAKGVFTEDGKTWNEINGKL